MASEASELSPDQNQAVAERVREALARRRMSRQQLADAARISLSTLEKALAGQRPFTLATTLRLEQALAIDLRPTAAVATAPSAPESLGSYSHEAVRWLEGVYLTLRPSFEETGSIYAYLTEISWSAARSHLVFCEAARLDASFTQSGAVSVATKSGQIYLQTNEEGQMRLAVLGRPTIGGAMYGLLTTLQVGAGTQLIPVATAFALVPVDGLGFEPALGRSKPDRVCHEAYRTHLSRVLDGGFARLVGRS